MQMLKLLLGNALIGLQFKGRLLAMPEIFDKGGRVMIMTNALAYYDTAIITAEKSFRVHGPRLCPQILD